MPSDTPDNDRTTTTEETRHPQQQTSTTQHAVKPALQIICLGAGGGPSEDNVTGFLVRSLDSGWEKGSVLAVDAGSHLAAITRILEESYPLYDKETASDGESLATSIDQGDVKTSSSISVSEDTSSGSQSGHHVDNPFAGVKFTSKSARANALHILHTHISCYLITHPHLDHLSGFVINTAAFHGRSRPKTLAALPGTVDAIKRHIFNDVIWPNLSDEDGGVGFVTFQRLKEGGDPMMGEGDTRGYMYICDGLGVKAFSVSHGLCTKRSSIFQHRSSMTNGADLVAALNKYGTIEPSVVANSNGNSRPQPDYTPGPGTPVGRRSSMFNPFQQGQFTPAHMGPCVVDSTAYFLRDEATSREVLIWGDVEPDSVSMMPRNEQVWTEAAAKFINGSLRAVFIECSYTDAVSDEMLFGHLCPRHLIAELHSLAEIIHDIKSNATAQLDGSGKKRKRAGCHTSDAANVFADSSGKRSRSQTTRHTSLSGLRGSALPHEAGRDNVQFCQTPDGDALSPRASATRVGSSVPYQALPVQAHRSRGSSVSPITAWDEPPLAGLSVVAIHIKDTFKDGPPVSETILKQLRDHDEARKIYGQALGCEFIISKSGQSYWF